MLLPERDWRKQRLEEDEKKGDAEWDANKGAAKCVSSSRSCADRRAECVLNREGCACSWTIACQGSVSVRRDAENGHQVTA